MRHMMKKMLPVLAVFVLSAALITPRAVCADPYTEVFPSGKIDWYRGVAEAVGASIIPAKARNSEKAKAKALNEAVDSARSNLLHLVGSIKIDSKTSVKHLFSQSDTFRARVEDLLKRISVQKVRYRANGRVEAKLTLGLAGSLSELVLPASIRIIESVQQPKTEVESKDKAFSGIIVDCLGVRGRPAMVPGVYDEDGQMVYGPPYISREHAVERGTAAYVRDLATAQRDERVSSKPLTVKGIRKAHTGPSDVVVSNSDAASIRGSANNLKLLQRCRVIIVLD